MAAVLQTTLKNNILSAYYSAQQIQGDAAQLNLIKQSVAAISFIERLLGLTPVAPSATVTIRTEDEITSLLDGIVVQIVNLSGDGDYADVQAVLLVVANNIGTASEYYRVFVN